MTTYAEESVVCGACGTVFTHHALASTNTFGSPDIDLRPSEMQRSTMDAWVQQCPSCGYCAQDATIFSESVRSLLSSDDYKRQLADADYPELARKFCCAGMLAEGDGKIDMAGRFFLNTAWACDDVESVALAKSLRSKAADLFMKALASGSRWCGEVGTEQLMILDCLRRAGRGEEAKAWVAHVLQASTNPTLHKVADFQRRLLDAGDVKCHTVEEAMER